MSSVTITAPVDPHRCWLEAYIENERAYKATDISHMDNDAEDAFCDAFLDEDTRLCRLIWETPAKTLDGLKAQIELLALEDTALRSGHPELNAYRNMLATLESLT